MIIAILLLTITVVLLFYRIKHTPMMLSRKIYFDKTMSRLEKQFTNVSNDNAENIKLIREIAIVLSAILQGLIVVYYIVLGAKVGIVSFTLLSVVQVLTVLCTSIRQLNMKLFSININDHKFYRWYFLFNVVLDYIYYPLAIYYLVC